MAKIKVFYGWIIVIACFIIAVIALGLGNGTSSLYVKPICDDMGFSRGAFSLLYTILSISQMVSSLAFARIYQMVGKLRVIFIIGIASITGAFSIYYLALNLYTFYVGAVLMGIGIAYSSTIPLSIIISNWFVEKRGTILSIIFAGTGIGGIIMNPLAGWWIAMYGWRTSYLYSIIIMLVFLVPVIFLLKEKPSEMGLVAYGEDKWKNRDIALSVDDLSEPSLVEVKKTPVFWFVLVAVFFFGLSVQPVYINASAHLGGVGLDPQIIAYIVSVIFFSNTLSKVFLGVINDRYGTKPVLLLNNSLFAIAVILLIFTRDNILGFAFAVAFGVGYTMISITTPLLIANIFGGKNYASIIGIMIASQTLGYSIGNPLIGLGYDIFHTYTYVFMLDILLDIAGVILALTALSRLRKANEVENGESVNM